MQREAFEQKENPSVGSPSAIMSGSSLSSVAGTSGAGSTVSVFFHQGSKQNPKVVLINLAHPEPHGHFDIKVSSRLVHRDVARQALNIKTHIGPSNKLFWKASMSIDMEDQCDHPNRVIIIQGPSQDSSLCAAATCTIDKEENTDIRSANVNALEAIRDDPSRSTYFWKLILPQGFELDNYCLSENHVDITKSTCLHSY